MRQSPTHRPPTLEPMTIIIKTQEQIEKMRIAGQISASVLTMIEPHVKPGITTEALDAICHHYITETCNAIPAALNYDGFPKSICTSVNHQVCHGIPSTKRLKEGDIINLDTAIIKDGYYGDTSKMYAVGPISVLAKRLVEVTLECLYLGISIVKPGIHTGDIGAVIEKHAHRHRFSVVQEYCGHGVGEKFHEEPQILHYGTPGIGTVLEPGMIFTIEPMINAGKRTVKLLPDQWTVVTKDHSLSAQWEHTILVTDTGFEILTLREEEKEPLKYFLSSLHA